MSMAVKPPADLAGVDLVEVPCPLEPKIAHKGHEPRKVSSQTLIDGKTFLASTVSGDIVPPGAPDVGLFSDDTRFLSHLELRVQGQRTVVLSSSTERSYAAQIELTTRAVSEENTLDIPENTVHLRREQLLANGIFYDSLRLENYNQRPAELKIELAVDADFMDIFQVRGMIRGKCGRYYKPVFQGDRLAFVYEGLDGVVRRTVLHFSPPPTSVEGGVVRWTVRLDPLQRMRLLTTVVPQVHRIGVDGRDLPPARSAEGTSSGPDGRGAPTHAAYEQSLLQRRQSFVAWEEQSTRLHSTNEVFDQALATMISDFHALQIPDGDEHIIAAGIPWFATIFGRDSIISGFQSLLLNPQLATDTLRILARYQGREVNDWRDEEPGKILHEHRSGEMTRDGEMPFGAYYGSVDATPLFLILFSETYNWTADDRLLEELMPAAMRALDWIDQYGDLDGDGLVEYKRRSPRGLFNQGWKDSGDAIMNTDGSIAEPPIALVEVQGYVYEAKYRMAQLLRLLGQSQRAERLRREAAEMTRRIERAFWMPQRRYFAMALDNEKRQVQSIASNPGHLLFTRSIGREKARMVVAELMRDGLYSGWGIRTMSQHERGYNPLSYHRGSVWPHDDSLVVHGMALYDFKNEAARVFTSLFQAALRFRDYRLPELFCGIRRREYDEPVQYPVSCSPQAWASGSMLLMLTSLLGIRPNAPSKELNIVNPVLPDFMESLSIRNMRVGRSRVGLDFTRQGDRTFCNVVDVQGDKLLVNVAFKR